MPRFSVPTVLTHFFVCVVIFPYHSAEAQEAHGDGPRSAEETASALKLYGGLQAQVFAAEPMITNPTNIAVDERGRVWVCDVVNYRGNSGKRPEGDRILVLEDEDGDGQADRSTLFYQGHDVDSALGICVLGGQVIVSCSPDIFVLSDQDGDGRADKKEVLYTKTGMQQHDHSAHAFVFGPDGNLYWNVGNTNNGVSDRLGNVVVDNFGRNVRNDGKPFRQGMAFRQSFEGDKFEVLAHNLRNSYELTVDAFGRVWFTDNDDDGYRGTRFCFALEGGNYGYTDELTGQHWRSGNRTGMNEQVPLRHWHQNDPGVVPNVMNNGSGSPSGIEAYEGHLLPEKLYGGIVHSEPGHNVVRVYLPESNGAGYSAGAVELIDGRADPWFRPVDVATAPDGSLMIADWYDPGVGGHRQADIDRGRIYRIAPAGSKYQISTPNTQSASAACESLCNPNHSVRFAAWSALHKEGAAAEPELELLSQSQHAQLRARAYWLLTNLPKDGAKYLNRATKDQDPRVRSAAARMATNRIETSLQTLQELADDASPEVRCAVAIALRNRDQKVAAGLWAELALQFDGTDRWYLEALGLAAEGRWDPCLNAWHELAGQNAWRSRAGRMLVWRSRGKQTFERLMALLSDPDTPVEELPQLLRAIDFNDSNSFDTSLLSLAEAALQMPSERSVLIASEALHRLRSSVRDTRLNRVLAQILDTMPHDDKYAQLIKKFRVKGRYDELLELALHSQADTNSGVDTLKFLIRDDWLQSINSTLSAGGPAAMEMLRMLAQTREPEVNEMLLPLITNEQVDLELRREVVRAIASNNYGAGQLVKLCEAGELDEQLHAALWFVLQSSPWQELKSRAKQAFPEAAKTTEEEFPIAEWINLGGNAKLGKKMFHGKANCATCHKIDDVGKEVGPALTEIGSKLSRTGLYESLLYPSAAISHNYESYVALTDTGTTIVGVLVGETDATITLKTDKAVIHELKRDELDLLRKQEISLMPSGIPKLLSPQELADLVKYLQTLKKRHAVSSTAPAP